MATAKLPTPDELKAVGRQLGMTLSDADVAFFLETMAGSVAAYHAIEHMADPMPPVKYPRTPGYRPQGAENKYNAWYYKSEVPGAPSGKLKGKRIALKDNVCLAGVPMMNGASTLEGYVPDVDATIVTRMLDAGGTILGKVHCEYFCFSGGSHTSAAGPVHNPRKMGYSAGGSSSGSAAVVVAGDVDMAIGGDQGGSIRIPAAYCGVYGMKPTHGLVPYTGVFPIENTLDHTGPMTATVADNALLLEVLAGPDGLDPRQVDVKTAAYTGALTGDARGMKIAVVKEGFGHPNSEADVDALVRKGAATFRQLGAQVDEVSIPLHLAGTAIWTPIAVEGATWQMLNGNGFGFNWKGLYVTSLIDAHSAWRQRADEFSDTLKTTILFGQYALNKYRGHYYAKSQNLGRVLRAAYDAVLKDYDLLLMPTLPLKATPIPKPGVPRMEIIQRAFEMLPNTAPIDVTGHPSMSVPCGLSDGLPAGMMLTAKHFDEVAIYRAASAFEKAGDWMGVRP
ncbi:MAG: amidase [Candidatus Rokuibacteriota bacterium]|nr:MAG: amidase [Candidatus Rokubacteria bacterium]